MKSSGENKESGVDYGFLRYNSSAALANFVQPIFTVFVPLLAVELGASVFEIGLVGGASSFVYSFMPFVMGRFSDRGEVRKFLIVLALSVLSIVSALYFFAQNPIDLILLRLFEGVGWATFWPCIESAMTHDTKMDPKKALSIFNLSWSSTAALGPLIGSFVVVIFSIRDAFIFNVLFLLAALSLSLVPYFYKVQRPRSDEKAETHSVEKEEVVPREPAAASTSDLGHLNISPAFYILSLVICTFTSGTLASFFSPYVHAQNLPIVWIGGAAFTYGIARFIGYLLTVNQNVRGLLMDHRTRIRNVFALLILVALSSTLMLVHDPFGVTYFLSFGLVGIGYSLVYSIAMVALLAEIRKEKMGLGAGIFESSIGIGGFTGPVIAGIVSGNSLTVPFVIPSISSIPVLTTLFFVSRSGSKKGAEVLNSA